MKVSIRSALVIEQRRLPTGVGPIPCKTAHRRTWHQIWRVNGGGVGRCGIVCLHVRIYRSRSAGIRVYVAPRAEVVVRVSVGIAAVMWLHIGAVVAEVPLNVHISPCRASSKDSQS